jgi:hypothetical protein
MTGKHVAAVFERLGFDPEGGIKVFNALCEALRRKEHMYQTARMADSAAASAVSSGPHEPPRAPVIDVSRSPSGRPPAQSPLSPQSGEEASCGWLYIYHPVYRANI